MVYYREQHHLFLFSKEYFSGRIHTEGLIAYLNNLAIQSFYMPILGSAILSGILAGIYPSAHYSFKKITGRTGLLQLFLVPPACPSIYTMSVDHSLTPVVGAFLGLLLLAGISLFITE